MADTRSLAEQDYLAGMKYKDIADKYGVTLNTVKSWKQRHGWNRDDGAHTKKGVHTKRGGAPPGNQYAKGNKGGAAPPRNINAVKHGLFQKYLPLDSLEIIQQLQDSSPIDILWENIMIQYTAIIRAQQIMYVRDRKDMTTTKIEEKGGNVWGEKWEVQQAWDKQATFLQAQARAMTSLTNMIKQYEELCRTEAADEEQQLRISKLKIELSALSKEAQPDQVVFKDDLHE